MRIFKIADPNGLELWLSTFGARILKLLVKTKKGNKINVHRYASNLNLYYTKEQFCGSVIGPIANRVKDGIAKIGDENFQMERNEKLNSLHSGFKGLHRHIWTIKERSSAKVIFETKIDHLEDHLPGNRKIQVIYEVKDTELHVRYNASTDQLTAINLSLHPYFNLSGKKNLDDHFFWLNSNQLTSIDKNKLTTGAILDTEGTIFDFTKSRQLPDDTIDHNFILNPSRNTNDPAAIIRSLKSAIELRLYCSQLGLQFYTGNPGYFAIEPQSHPDALNHPHFPTIELSPDEVYDHSMIFAFHDVE